MQPDPGMVFAKTAAGAEELRARKAGLGPRARQLLILVDGRRSVADLARILPPGELPLLIDELEALGLIARPPAPVPAAAASAPAAPSPSESLLAARQRAIRALLDTIGPNGEDFAIRLERCASADEIGALMPAIVSVVEAVGGRVAVEQFQRRMGAR